MLSMIFFFYDLRVGVLDRTIMTKSERKNYEKLNDGSLDDVLMRNKM